MAGVALYDDVGELVERNAGRATPWLQSVRLLRVEHEGTAAEENRNFWPVLTQQSVDAAETGGPRPRIFAMAVTAPLDMPPSATSWSHAVDQLAYNDGTNGRLFCLSIGNANPNDPVLAQSYPLLNLDQRIEDPAQAVNALTIGAYTQRKTLPPDGLHEALACLVPEGGVSPYARAGIIQNAVKPDVVFEGGNVAFDGLRGWVGSETLSTLTTRREFTRTPLGLIWGTSSATAQAARFAAQVWSVRPKLWPETVRG